MIAKDDPPRRAAIYCRISKDRTGERAGTTRQEADCLAHVERHGWDLVEDVATGMWAFTDNDISAYAGKPRQAFERLMTMVEARAVDVIVAWHPDRLTRHPKELERIIDTLEAARCTVDTVMAGRWDLSTRSGRTQARLVGVVARDESEAKSERLRAMHEHKARNGEYRGSTRHYGYRPGRNGGMEVVSEEADVVRECAARVLAGETLNSIVNDLNRRSVSTVKGASWRTPTLRRTLTSWTICGRREHHGDEVGPAKWEAIIDRSTRDKLHRIIYDPDRTRPAPARVSLLAGIARCAHCGAKLITGRRKTGRRVYVCPATSRGGCGAVQVVADGGNNPAAGGLDDLVAAAVIKALAGPALANELADARAADDPSADDPSADLAKVEDEMAELAADLGAGRITRREWLAARGPLEARRDAARAKEAAGTRTTVLIPYTRRPDALSEAWPGLTLDQQRAIVAAVVDRVTVSRARKRGPGFDADRVAIEWSA